MTEQEFKCSGCSRILNEQHFGKLKNGNRYKTCLTYCRKYIQKGIKKAHKRCPIWGWQRRSCQHCKRPHEFPILCKTIDNKKLLNCEINSYFEK